MKLYVILILLCITITTYSQTKNKIINITNKNEVSSLAIINDTVWIGSSGGVILRDLSGKLLNSYNTTDGLGYDFVSSIASDSSGNMWFATIGKG